MVGDEIGRFPFGFSLGRLILNFSWITPNIYTLSENLSIIPLRIYLEST